MKYLILTALLLTQNTYADWTTRNDEYILNEYAHCSGNNSNGSKSYDVNTFNAAAAKAKLVKSDKDGGCTLRRYSKSREEAIQMYLDLVSVENKEEWSQETRSCLEEYTSKNIRKEFERMIRDPKNLGVFVSFYDPTTHNEEFNSSEACSYYDIDIYRPNGTKLSFTFNYTD